MTAKLTGQLTSSDISYLRSTMTKLLTIRQINDIIFKHVENQTLTNGNAAKHDAAGYSPRQSASACIIPLGSEPSIRIFYVANTEHVRFGKILEDLDTFAVWMAYRHNQGPEVPMGTPNHIPFHAVTACVDKINLKHRTIKSDLDILMTGLVTWVGRSSIEVTMHLSQKYAKDEYRGVLTARFVMVTLDPKTQKAVSNVPLKLETEQDKKLFEKGEYAKQVRRSREEMSLYKNPPTEIERAMLHDLFLKTMDNKNHSLDRLPAGHVWMNDAKVENMVICFPIKRNMYGKIFGGYLMRTAVETAFANAALFSKSNPEVMAVDSVVFKKGVEIGSLLVLQSQISYTTDRFMQLSVSAHVVDINNGDSETTTTFQFTFRTDKPVPVVLPQTYSDGMAYLNSRRHFNSSAHL
ncbi:unnamed protein product [Bursaphelenchus xylophilus]|uniref:(pine wood nematode) hypothetical protein n=1 Tax=Bursaphelenchus xylophilus TaxID=6326 RepID=A0A7I8WPI8_BURXY|nr:unnamed protein product [Bursaphelenchus xylophilus]CAG9095161.1 unnamed protein product [Bursaphelenchus xylophilus]